MDWQPIETAPERTRVLVWREDCGTWIAEYNTDEYYNPFSEESEHVAWVSEAGFHEGREAPTHWMPLPQPPTVG